MRVSLDRRNWSYPDDPSLGYQREMLAPSQTTDTPVIDKALSSPRIRP